MSRVPKYALLPTWEKYYLKDLCEKRSENYEPKPKGSLKYIGLEHIKSGNPAIKDFGYENEVKSSKHKFYPKDILYGKLRPYLDKVVLSSIEGISSSDILIFTPKSSKILPNYLIKLLHEGRFLKYASSTMTGTTLPRTNWKTLSKFVFYIPQLSEQQKIVSILENVDNLIQTTQQLIDKLHECKKGLMQRLFTQGIGHTEYKEVKIRGKMISIPTDWKIVKLNQILTLEYGKGLKSSDRNGGQYPVMGSNGIVGSHDSYKVKGPGIIVGRKGSMGQVNWVDENFWPIDTTYYVKQKNTDIPMKWLYHALDYLNLPRLKLHDVVPGLNRDYAYSQKILLPKYDEMSKITSILENCDKTILIEESYNSKLRDTKKGLMQILLTGKKRVSV